MRKLWNTGLINLDVKYRSGISLYFGENVEKEIKRANICFVRWLRKNYFFPRHINVFYTSTKKVTAYSGAKVYSWSFFPDCSYYNPFIEIAVGDYFNSLKVNGKDNALAESLHSLSYELSLYFQWIKGMESNKKQARYYGENIVWDYAKTREHP